MVLLEDKVGGYFNRIAWGARPLIEGAFSGATEISDIPEIRRFTANSGVVRVAMGAAQQRLSGSPD